MGLKHLGRKVSRPSPGAPNVHWRESGKDLPGLLPLGAYLGLQAHPIRPGEVGIFRLQPLLVEPCAAWAGLAAEVQRAALFREILPVPGLATEHPVSLLHSTTCPVKPREPHQPQGDCPYKLGLFVDLSGNAESDTVALAERSADGYYRRIPGFVRAYFVAKKLDEFSEHLVRRGKVIRPLNSVFSVGELYGLQGEPFAEERDKFFGERLAGLLESLSEGDAGLDSEVEAITKMGLSDFETYIEILVALRGAFHRKYIIESLDSTMLKNRPGALLAQTRARNAPRRFTLDSRLLEVLLQIAVLRPGGDKGYFTGEMRIDDLLAFLRERYGLYIDQLPPGEGFAAPTIDERKALRSNVQAFTARLREIGFYRDLSDAYVTQTVVPRYTIAEKLEGART